MINTQKVTSQAQVCDHFTTCGLCQQLVRDSRTLPCLDSFCLPCLEIYHLTANYHLGRPTCPMCGETFVLPVGGVKSLPFYGFIDKISELRMISNDDGTDGSCEICLLSSGDRSPASKYCLDCRQKLCSACHGRHGMFSATRKHVSVDVGAESCQRILNDSKSQTIRCSIHEGQEAIAHCHYCNVHVCLPCVDAHTGHELEFLDVDTAARYQTQIEQLIVYLSDMAAANEARIAELKQDLDIVRKNIDDIEAEINRKADEKISLIQQERRSLNTELTKYCQENIETIRTTFVRGGQHIARMQTALLFANELCLKGSVSDALDFKRILSHRVQQLLKTSDADMRLNGNNKILFTPVDGTQTTHLGAISESLCLTGSSNMIQRPFEQKSASFTSVLDHARHSQAVCHPQLVKELLANDNVCGVTQLANNIYVVTCGSNIIQVFGVNGKQLDDIEVKGLEQPQDIVACSETRSLFIADHATLMRVSVDGRVDKFLKYESRSLFRPYSLSASLSRLLVTTCNDELVVYTLDGYELKYLSLCGWDLKHAVFTSSHTFLVCHLKPDPRISEVNEYGHVIRRFKDRQHLSVPSYLSLADDGRIFIADYYKSYIVTLDSSDLSCVSMDTDHSQLVQNPHRLCYIESTRQLVVVGLGSPVIQFFAT